jgi:hypothetical protein
MKQSPLPLRPVSKKAERTKQKTDRNAVFPLSFGEGWGEDDFGNKTLTANMTNRRFRKKPDRHQSSLKYR